MGDSTKEQLTLFAEATPASRSARQGISADTKTHDTSGPKCSDSFENAAPGGSLPRMFADTFQTVSTTWPHNWKVKASPSGRLLFQLQRSMRPTNANGYGWWPTPRASHGMTGRLRTPEAILRTQARRAECRLEDEVVLAEGRAGGYLNPLFVEWLMGFPIGWTALEPSGMLSCRKSQS